MTNIKLSADKIAEAFRGKTLEEISEMLAKIKEAHPHVYQAINECVLNEYLDRAGMQFVSKTILDMSLMRRMAEISSFSS